MTQTTPLISIIVPVYNVEEYIYECIKSIQNQTYTNLEILVINDGTKDKSIDVIKFLIDSDPRIKVISQENQGLSAARNTGLDHCSGKYVAMIDSDDTVKPEFISDLYNEIKNGKVDIVRDSFRDFDGEIPSGWISDFNTSKSRGKDVLSEFLDNSTSFVVWSSLYRTKFLNDNQLRFTNGILLEDGDFTCRAYMRATYVKTINKSNYKYRIRPGSILTTNNAEKMSRSEMIVINKFLDLITEYKFKKDQFIIKKAIYAFMRDWTRILTKNKIKIDLNQSSFNKATKEIKAVLKHRPIKEQLKFYTKIAIIKFKNYK